MQIPDSRQQDKPPAAAVVIAPLAPQPSDNPLPDSAYRRSGERPANSAQLRDAQPQIELPVNSDARHVNNADWNRFDDRGMAADAAVQDRGEFVQRNSLLGNPVAAPDVNNNEQDGRQQRLRDFK